MLRAVFGLLMLGVFFGIICAGHIYVCAVIMIMQGLVFRELVNVRYEASKEKHIPLFRTIQWVWFAVGLYYTYGDFLLEFAVTHPRASYLVPYVEWVPFIAMMGYAAVFILSILTLRKGLYRYQVSLLTWTIVILCIVILQSKYVGNNIFNGLFWFLFPASLVICNDTTAYFCGVLFGKKFISKPFLKLSPNKTWEGFIGAAICTSVAAFFVSRYFAQFSWLICPLDDIYFVPRSQLECEPHYVFQVAELSMPVPLQELLPYLSRFKMTAMPIQGHAVCLALFVSLVAPFGGFMASAIKRAYEIKDFDSIIPGHGGFMDRLDCQFITALFTWVYYNTFIRSKLASVAQLTASAALLDAEGQRSLLAALQKMVKAAN